MSYVKQTWVDYETRVDAEHLNHIEDGIEANDAAVAALSEEIDDFTEEYAADNLADIQADDIYVNGNCEVVVSGDSISAKNANNTNGNFAFLLRGLTEGTEYTITLVNNGFREDGGDAPSINIGAKNDNTTIGTPIATLTAGDNGTYSGTFVKPAEDVFLRISIRYLTKKAAVTDIVISEVGATKTIINRDLLRGIGFKNFDEEVKDALGADIEIKANMPRAMFRQLKNYDESADKFVTFCDVYSEYNTTLKTTNYVYGLTLHTSSGTKQSIYRSADGGETWKEFLEVAIDAANGVYYTNIFVDAQTPTIYLLKTTDGATGAANAVDSYAYNGESWFLRGTLNIGEKFWLGCNNSIDAGKTPDGAYVAVMFGEYGTTRDGQTYSIWRTINSGRDWNKVLELNGESDNISGSGDIRHWHCVQYDPYTAHWWAGSGDSNSQCKIYRSTDGGLTWELMYSGSQRDRLCNFVIEEDCMYYGMDSRSEADEQFTKIVKINKSDMSREDVAFVDKAYPVYGLSKVYMPDGFIVWAQYEPGGSTYTGRHILQFYDYATGKLMPIGRLDTSFVDGDQYIGFEAGARMQQIASGIVFAKPRRSLLQDRFGYVNTSAYVKVNVTL